MLETEHFVRSNCGPAMPHRNLADTIFGHCGLWQWQWQTISGRCSKGKFSSMLLDELTPESSSRHGMLRRFAYKLPKQLPWVCLAHHVVVYEHNPVAILQSTHIYPDQGLVVCSDPAYGTLLTESSHTQIWALRKSGPSPVHLRGRRCSWRYVCTSYCAALYVVPWKSSFPGFHWNEANAARHKMWSWIKASAYLVTTIWQWHAGFRIPGDKNRHTWRFQTDGILTLWIFQLPADRVFSTLLCMCTRHATYLPLRFLMRHYGRTVNCHHDAPWSSFAPRPRWIRRASVLIVSTSRCVSRYLESSSIYTAMDENGLCLHINGDRCK